MTDDRKLLRELGEIVHAGSKAREEESTSERAERERARFLRAAIDAEESGGKRLRRYAPAMIVFAVAAVVVGVGRRMRERAIGYSVDGAADASGGFVRAPLASDAIVRFTDGSSVDLAPGATGRVTTLRAKGARFSVEGGSVTVHIEKRDGGADYDIDAGPYDVHVTGTRFGVSWNPSRQAMRLRLDEGSVIVTGPHAEAGVGLRAGQTLVAKADEGIRIAASGPSDGDAEGGTPDVTSVSSASNVTLPGASEPHRAAPDESVAGSGSSTSPTASADAPKRPSWSERVAKGDFAGVLADADAHGVDALVGSAPLDDLMALADAARYGGRSNVALACLRAVRQRFTGSRAASTAAFLLGRMAEDGGDVAGAMRFYDATMAEGGVFSGEALGRKMLLVKGSSGNAGAKSLAKQYLDRFPSGPYASAAKSILGS